MVAALRQFCDDHLHENLTGPQIWAHLEGLGSGFRRRLLAGDQNVVDGLHRTVERHQRRIASSAPTFGTLKRTDTASLINRLQAPEGKQIIVVEGRAGIGKSTVVSDVAAQLEVDGWFVAVARMDGVDATTNTSDKLGAAVGLVESPTVLLAGVADGSQALLIVDQLDAVSTYSGRMTDAFDSVADMLSEIAATSNVKVLLVARTVDLEGDPRLRQLLNDVDRVERFTIGRFSVDEVTKMLSDASISVPTSPVTLDLLRTPLHLAVFSRLSDAARGISYLTLQELYETLTSEVRSRVEARVGHLDWTAITGALANFMSEHEALTAPAALLDFAAVAEIRALESDAILVRDNERIGFFHESYFDFLFARAFVGDGHDLHIFLASSGQQLFRRAQTRQILEHLGATDRSTFRACVARLLTSPEIRE